MKEGVACLAKEVLASASKLDSVRYTCANDRGAMIAGQQLVEYVQHRNGYSKGFS
jgi:hypothetical protein